MTDPTFEVTPVPARIFASHEHGMVNIAIHADTITAIDLHPEDAYSVARYLEWLCNAGECPEPSNGCPDGMGVWGEDRDTGRVVHVVVVGDDDMDGYGKAACIDTSTAQILSNKLYAAAVSAGLWGYEEGEDDE